MKNRIILVISAIVIMAFPTTVLAQHHHHDNHEDHSSMHMKDQYEVNSAFTEQITELYETYINLKGAFVSSNPTSVQTHAKDMKKQLGKVDMTLLEEDAHVMWMEELKTINQQLAAISETSDLEKQRELFAPLSESMYRTVKAFGLSGMNAYYQFCPMAMGGEGGHWLSTSEEINNPYFGDRMLRCGRTVEHLK